MVSAIVLWKWLKQLGLLPVLRPSAARSTNTFPSLWKRGQTVVPPSELSGVTTDKRDR